MTDPKAPQMPKTQLPDSNQWQLSSARINTIVELTGARRYLEVGVFRGETFGAVNCTHRCGVDPDPQFDVSTVRNADTEFHVCTSDAFFTGAAGREFDTIFLDGLHTYEQTLRDFVNSLSCAHARTVWLIDDTWPADFASSLPSLSKVKRYRSMTGERARYWHGDVYKLIFSLHDFFPLFDWRTVIDRGNPQTILMRSPRASFKPRWNDLATISRFGYQDFVDNHDLLRPSSEVEALAWLKGTLSAAGTLFYLNGSFGKAEASTSEQAAELGEVTKKQGVEAILTPTRKESSGANAPGISRPLMHSSSETAYDLRVDTLGTIVRPISQIGKCNVVGGDDEMHIDRRLSEVNAYLSTGISTVSGWCIPQLWQTLWPLHSEIGDGPVAEIGVFEGKFFIGLCKTFGTTRANRAAVIDVFDMQQFNLDGAGVGKMDVLKRNLTTHGIAEGAIEFVQADSLALSQRDANGLAQKLGEFHFFSVDGCHDVVHTVNDIEFAMSVTANHGIISVDGYTNPNWPGVQEAIARMYLMRDFAFVPLVVTCNKLLLASYSYHAKYLDAVESYVRGAHPDTRMKRVRRFGYDTLTVQPNLQQWTDLTGC